MNPHHPTPTHTPQGLPPEDRAYYQEILHGLVAMGNDIAREIHHRATTRPATENSAPDLATAFDRVARAIRRTILLAQKLAEPPPNRTPTPEKAREAARKRILREVEDAIHRDAPAKAAPALHAELQQRLDAPDLLEDIDSRPIEHVIADICRDLGVPPATRLFKWKRRTPVDIANLVARAATHPASTPRPPPPRPPPTAPPS